MHCQKENNQSYQPVVQREGRDDGLVPLAALLELGHVQASVFVLVHHPEDLPYSFFGGIFVFGEFDHGTNHFIDGLHDGQHLVVTDLAVAVNVVELKGPIQLVLHLAAAGDAQGADELLEVDRAALVRVKDLEDVVGERTRVAKGEKLSVYLLELFLGERARRAILQKSIVVIPSCQNASTVGVPPAVAATTWTVSDPSWRHPKAWTAFLFLSDSERTATEHSTNDNKQAAGRGGQGALFGFRGGVCDFGTGRFSGSRGANLYRPPNVREWFSRCRIPRSC